MLNNMTENVIELPWVNWRHRKKNNEERRQKLREIDDGQVSRFNNWLANARKGDKFKYFQGLHIVGFRVGELARKAYATGEITLYQKRETNQFSYWAQKL